MGQWKGGYGGNPPPLSVKRGMAEKMFSHLWAQPEIIYDGYNVDCSTQEFCLFYLLRTQTQSIQVFYINPIYHSKFL